MDIQQITSNELTAMCETSEVLVLDIRNIETYEESHIPGARHTSTEDLNDIASNFEKAHPIVVYCYHGISSLSVAQLLIDQGFTNVCSLKGGYEMWCEYKGASSN